MSEDNDRRLTCKVNYTRYSYRYVAGVTDRGGRWRLTMDRWLTALRDAVWSDGALPCGTPCRVTRYMSLNSSTKNRVVQQLQRRHVVKRAKPYCGSWVCGRTCEVDRLWKFFWFQAQAYVWRNYEVLVFTLLLHVVGINSSVFLPGHVPPNYITLKGYGDGLGFRYDSVSTDTVSNILGRWGLQWVRSFLTALQHNVDI